MAVNPNDDVILFKINLDTGEAEINLGDLKKKVKDSTTPEKDTFKNYSKQIKEATDEAQKLSAEFGNYSKQAVDARKKLSDLKEEYKDFNDAVVQSDPGNKFRALGSLAKGAVGSIQAVSGAMAVFGSESDRTNEMLVKLQGLINLSMALDSIDDVKNSFKNLTSVLGLTTAGLTKAQIAAKGFGLALKAIGIGLITAAIAYLIDKWDDLKDSVSDLLPELGQTTESFKEIVDWAKAIGGTLVKHIILPFRIMGELFKQTKSFFSGDGWDNSKMLSLIKETYDVLGTKEGIEKKRKEGEARELLKTQLDIEKRELERRKNRGENVEKLEIALAKRYLNAYEKGSKEYLEAMKHYEDLKDRLIAKQNEKRKQDEQKRKEEEEKARLQALKDAEEFKKIMDQNQRDIEKSFNDSREQFLKEQARQEKEIADAKRKRQEDSDNQYIKSKESQAIDAETDVYKAEAKLNRPLGLLEQLGLKNNLKDLERYFDERAKLINRAADAEIAKAEGDATIIRKINAKRNADLLLNDTEKLENTKSLKGRELEFGMAMADATSGLMGALGDLAGEDSQAKKDLAIAGAVIDTIRGGVSAYIGGVAAFPGPAGVALGATLAATALATGYAQVKKIKEVNIKGKKGGGSTLPPAPTITSTILAPQTPQDVNLVGMNVSNKPEPVRAYVVQEDLETNQRRASFMNEVASF